MSEAEPWLHELKRERRFFLDLVAQIRPDLHRYCARMMGSVTDGEDVVQDALARAYYELAELEHKPALRAWLFRIAHNRALDLLRSRQRHVEVVELDEEIAVESSDEAADAIAREQVLKLAMGRFLRLSPLQRSCVILKDVLGDSLSDIAQLLDSNTQAVKAALSRGRLRITEIASDTTTPPPRQEPPALLQQYVDRFNAHDWAGVRELLAEDVRLDLISVSKRSGREDVSAYFTNYGSTDGWHLRVAWLEGRAVIAVVERADAVDAKYLIELQADDRCVVRIRDYRYVRYIAREAVLQF